MKTHFPIPVQRFKPVAGTPLDWDNPLTGRKSGLTPTGGGMILCAALMEGVGGRTWDSGPLNCKTFGPGPAVTAAAMGFTTSVATSVFSGWRAGQMGPAMLISSADHVFSGGNVLSASEALFMSPKLVPGPNESAPLTMLCKWYSFVDPPAPAQLWSAGERDDGGFLQGVGILGTGFLEYNASSQHPSTIQPKGLMWNTTAVIKPPGPSGNLTFFHNGFVQSIAFSGELVANTRGTPNQSVGAMWANSGVGSDMFDGAGPWNGLIEYCYAWDQALTIDQITGLAFDPYSIFAVPSTRRWFLPPPASETGIAFNAASNSGYQAAAGSYSGAAAWAGSNRMLSIDVHLLSVTATVTAMTYGGAACTFIGAQNVAGGTGRVECWRICQNDAGAPGTGSNTLSVTLSGSLAFAVTWVSRTGVNQGLATEAFNSISGINVGAANASIAITPTSDNTVVHAACATNDAAASANQTGRNDVTGTAGSGIDEDSGATPISPAAAQTMTVAVGAARMWAIAGYAVRPTTDASIWSRFISDNVGINDVVATLTQSKRIVIDNLGTFDGLASKAASFRLATDNLGGNDGVSRFAPSLRSLVDNLGVHDSIATLTASKRALTDNLGTSDRALTLTTSLRALADNLGISDALALSVVISILISDNLGVSDGLARKVASLRLATDNIGGNDTLARLATALRAVADNVGINDTLARLAPSYRALADNLGLSDTVARLVPSLRTVSDNVGESDAVSRKVASLRALSDLLGVSDQVSRLAASYRTSTDNVGINTVTTTQTAALRALADNLGITDTVSRLAPSFRALADNLGLNDTVARRAPALRAIAENLGVTDQTATLAAYKRFVSDNIGISDLIIAVKGGALVIRITDNLGITDAFSSRTSSFRTLADNLGLSSQVGTATTSSRAIQDALGASDAAQRLHRAWRLASDNTGLSDATARKGASLRQAIDNLGVADLEAHRTAAFRAMADSLGLQDATARLGAFSRTAQDALGLTDTATTRLFIGLLISDAIGVTDALHTQTASLRTVQDLLGIIDEVLTMTEYLRQVADSLGLSDEVMAELITALVLSAGLFSDNIIGDGELSMF